MKCFVVLSFVAMAAGAPQYYLADTPEVTQAKLQFAAAYNKAARASLSALQEAGVNNYDPEDPDYSPPAEPYVHVEIPAEEYVHEEVPDVRNEGQDFASAPVAPVASAVQPVQHQSAPSQNVLHFAPSSGFNFAGPVQPLLPALASQQGNAGGCYNWKGEGVPCRQ